MIHKATFTDLPYEVQEQIEPYLNQQDLSVCVRVCQAWRVLYNPYLWTHVDIIWDEAAATRSTPYALKTNAHLIHSLKLDCDFDQFPHFLNICPDSYFPHLTSAQIYATCDEDDWAIVKFIRRGSPTGWKRLDLSWRYSIYRKVHFGAHLFDAIIRNAARTLEVLRFEGDSYIGSKEINRLLCSAPKLKELSFTNKKMKRSGGLLDAREIVRSEWICSDLEIFACRIGKIPRPDIMRNIFGRANDSFIHRGSPKESIAIQRLVYAKLARLTKLRELRLGFPLDTSVRNYHRGDKEYYQQYGCLAMTLESGLDLLKGLKELRVVGLEDMEVYIDDDKEKAWFAQNWPNAVLKTDVYTTDKDNRA